jgi:hypothetical protein
MGKKRTKHFKEKSFIQNHSESETRDKAFGHSIIFTTPNYRQEEPTLYRENFAAKPRVDSCGNCGSIEATIRACVPCENVHGSDHADS